MHPGKVNGRLVRGDRNSEITKRIEWYSRPDKFWGVRIKDRIGCVQDTIKARRRHLLADLDVLKLAVAPAGVVAPTSVEEFVSFDAESCKNGIGLVVE